MVLFGAKLRDSLSNQYLVREMHDNLTSKQASFLMFRDDSFIKFVNKDTVVCYLNPLFPKYIVIIVSTILLVLGMYIFRSLTLTFIAIGLLLLYYSFSRLAYFLFVAGMRKKGCKDKIGVV